MNTSLSECAKRLTASELKRKCWCPEGAACFQDVAFIWGGPRERFVAMHGAECPVSALTGGSRRLKAVGGALTGRDLIAAFLDMRKGALRVVEAELDEHSGCRSKRVHALRLRGSPSRRPVNALVLFGERSIRVVAFESLHRPIASVPVEAVVSTGSLTWPEVEAGSEVELSEGAGSDSVQPLEVLVFKDSYPYAVISTERGDVAVTGAVAVREVNSQLAVADVMAAVASADGVRAVSELVNVSVRECGKAYRSRFAFTSAVPVSAGGLGVSEVLMAFRSAFDYGSAVFAVLEFGEPPEVASVACPRPVELRGLRHASFEWQATDTPSPHCFEGRVMVRSARRSAEFGVAFGAGMCVSAAVSDEKSGVEVGVNSFIP